MKKFFSIFCFVLMVFSFAGCKGIFNKKVEEEEEEEEPVTCTVTFVSEHGTAPDAIKVDINTFIQPYQLTVMKFDGYIFTGWYDEEDKKVLANQYYVTKDVTFTAGWEEKDAPVSASLDITGAWEGTIGEGSEILPINLLFKKDNTCFASTSLDMSSAGFPDIPFYFKGTYTLTDGILTTSFTEYNNDYGTTWNTPDPNDPMDAASQLVLIFEFKNAAVTINGNQLLIIQNGVMLPLDKKSSEDITI